MQEVVENSRGVRDRAAPRDTDAIRRDFPILDEQVHGSRLVWLDNASTTQNVHDLAADFYAFSGHKALGPTLRSVGLESAVHPSLSVYNNQSDVDALVAWLHRIVAAGRGLKEA